MAKDLSNGLIDPVSSEPVVSKPSASKASGKKKAKKNVFKSIAKWFREMKSEIKKVVWPTPKEAVKMSLIALAVMVASAVVIWGFDKLAQYIVEAIISIGG